uniref:Importin-5-like n=1 Tax=Nicotiana tabacum TaxID=4097 RepID=A0A1S4AD59_TOBAC|nr:PREDICTED: importin-5-like [Nicotiana tabacum]
MKKVLEDKATVCITLSNCAAELKEDFYPWIPQVVSVLLPLLKFYSHNNVRKYAVGAMYPLLHSTKLAVENGIAQGESESYFKELSDYIILSVLEALHEEPMTEVCAFMLAELNNCMQISPPLLIEGQLRRIVDEVKHVITESSSRRRKLKERTQNQKTLMLRKVGTVVGTLIKIFKAGFLPFLFDELSPYLIPMWNALYGLALYAVYGGYVFKPFITEAISRINVVITHLRAHERENESVYCTAVLALSKICQFHLESIDSSAQVICSEEELATEETTNRMINILRYPQP